MSNAQYPMTINSKLDIQYSILDIRLFLNLILSVTKTDCKELMIKAVSGKPPEDNFG